VIEFEGIWKDERSRGELEERSASRGRESVLVFGASWRMEDDKREARSGPRLPPKHTNGTENGGKSGKVDSQARERKRNGGWPQLPQKHAREIGEEN
jgi:hypothetical protein